MDAELIKRAVNIVQYPYNPVPRDALGKNLHRTTNALNMALFGGPAGLLQQAMIAQDRLGDWLTTPDEAQHRKAVKRMEKHFGPELADVDLRLGHQNLLTDWKRTWQNKHTTIPTKLFGTLTAPLTTLQTAFSRASHYNPITNTAVVYNDLPDVTSHELGHAADFNKKPKWLRELYMHAGLPDRAMLGVGPLTLWQEIAANRNVNKSLRHLPKSEQRAHEAEAWRRLTPAFSTYVTGAGLGGLYAQKRYRADVGKPAIIDQMRDATEKALGKVMSSDAAKDLAPWALPLGLVGAGTLAGRGIAELRNAVTAWNDRRQDKKKKKSAHSGKQAAAMSLAEQLGKQAAFNYLAGRPKWSPSLQNSVSRYFWKWRHPVGQSFRLPVSRTVPKALRGQFVDAKNRQDPYVPEPVDGEDELPLSGDQS